MRPLHGETDTSQVELTERETPGQRQRRERVGLTLEDISSATRKELSTKLVWAVSSSLHVGGYGHWTKLRKWADRLAEQMYERRLDFLDFKR